jgi:hypothetical protein
MQVRVKENSNEFGGCGCGRSPTGKCIGWHGLTQEQFIQARRQYDSEEYRKQAMDQFFEDGSCTGGQLKNGK